MQGVLVTEKTHPTSVSHTVHNIADAPRAPLHVRLRSTTIANHHLLLHTSKQMNVQSPEYMGYSEQPCNVPPSN
jgi:hypothetical protein